MARNTRQRNKKNQSAGNRIEIEKEGAIADDESSSASSPVNIKDVSASGAKVSADGNELGINLNLPVNHTRGSNIQQATEAAIGLGKLEELQQLENLEDAVEAATETEDEDLPPATAPTEQPTGEQPTETTAKPSPTPVATETPAQKPAQGQQPPQRPAQPTKPPAPNQNQAPAQTAPQTTPETEPTSDQTREPNTEPLTEPPKTEQQSNTPPQTATQPNPNKPEEKPPESPTQPPPTGPTPPKQDEPVQPPTKEDLSRIGPRPKDAKTPPTLENQPEVGNQIASDKAQNRNFGQRMSDRLGQKGKNIKENIKKIPENAIKNLKDRFESDRSKTRKLRQERKKLEDKLNELNRKVRGVKSSLSMRIIRFWFPGIYAQITGFTFGIANAKDELKIKMLETKMIQLRATQAQLISAKVTAAMFEAVEDYCEAVAATSGTVILAVILILAAPLAILVFFIMVYGSGAGPITKAIGDLSKETGFMIDDLNAILNPERDKVKIRRKIQLLNVMLASKEARELGKIPENDDKPKTSGSEPEQTPTTTPPTTSI